MKITLTNGMVVEGTVEEAKEFAMGVREPVKPKQSVNTQPIIKSKICVFCTKTHVPKRRIRYCSFKCYITARRIIGRERGRRISKTWAKNHS